MTTTTTLPGGEVVVPMSTLLDALSGVLSPAERLKLFNELLNLRPQEVAPGDLITADLFNRILSDINDLMLRVASLEANADTSQIPPRIDSILPQIVRAGDEIIVSGQGLAAVNLQTLRFDNTPLAISAIKPGSTQTRMLINAPALIGLPAQGKQVILSLSNGAGQAQGTFTELPGMADNLQTKISFVQKGIKPGGKIQFNTQYTLSLEVTVAASADEVFDVVAAISGAGFKLISASPSTIDVKQASAITPETHQIEVVILTGPTGTGILSLSLRGQHYVDAVGVMVPSVDFTVEKETDLPSDKIIFGTPTVKGPNDIVLSSATPLIRIAKNALPGLAELTLPVTLTQGGKIALADVKFDSGNWTAKPISNLDLSLNPNISSNLVLTITPSMANNAPISTSGTIDFTVTTADGTERRPFHADIKIL